MTKPQCTTQAEVFEQFARVSKMIEGTALSLDTMLKYDNRQGRMPAFDTLTIGIPEKYSFALAIVEGKPVFVGDKLWYCAGEYKPIKFTVEDYWKLENVFGGYVSWQEPKRTFMLNGEELPLPHDKGHWYLYFDKFSWKNEEDRDRVQAVIGKLFRGESK